MLVLAHVGRAVSRRCSSCRRRSPASSTRCACSTWPATPRAVPRWRQALLLRRPDADRRDARRAARPHRRRAVPRAHGRAPAVADLAALLLVLGLTGPLLAPVLRIRLLRPAARARPPARGAAAVGAEPLRLAHRRCCTRPRCATPASTRCSTCCSSRSARTCGWRCSGRCPSRPGSATSRAWATSSPCACSARSWPTCFVFGGNAFYDVYATGEALRDISPAGRPERGRRRS